MTSNAIGYLFPAFVSAYLGEEKSLLQSYGPSYDNLMEEASSFLSLDLRCFDPENNPMLDDELKTQYITYVISCVISEILHRDHYRKGFVAGYSMGIYAALYHCRSISFVDGLALIRGAFHCISATTCDKQFGMGTIIGLSEEETHDLINDHFPGTEIINTNSKHSLIVSGLHHEIEGLVKLAMHEGALNARILPVTVPYHSSYMAPAATCFEEFIRKISIKQPQQEMISVIDRSRISSAGQVKTELIRNISHTLNWKMTMDTMINLGVNVFLECGAGNNLFRTGKFIDGDFRIFPINKLPEFLKL
ncbi:MAG: acyltransferase domain-containing protein [Bacteroidetes bacterium]|nr:acyltransferase domain-containing protein [Bacteroidota bacterium]